MTEVEQIIEWARSQHGEHAERCVSLLTKLKTWADTPARVKIVRRNRVTGAREELTEANDTRVEFALRARRSAKDEVSCILETGLTAGEAADKFMDEVDLTQLEPVDLEEDTED